MAYIYKIINDINNKQYVGKTELTIEQRFKEHQRDAYRQRCEKRPLYSAMRKYGVEHFSIELLEETDNPSEREVYWIEKLDTFHNGYNATKGGDGKHYLDDELIIKTYLELQSCTDVAKKLNCHSESVSKVLKNANIPIVDSHKVIKQKYGKPVNQYDLKTHELLNTYLSLTEAEQAIGVESGRIHISDCCRGRRKSAYGYYWQFV